MTCDDYLYLQDTQLRMEQAAMAQTKLIHRQEADNQSHSLSVPDPESTGRDTISRILDPPIGTSDFPDKIS